MLHRTFAPFATLALLALTLGTAGCSNGSSPTEPAISNLDSSSAAVSSTGDKRHGADDPAGDDRGGQAGRGADDPAGDDHGGRRGRGADDPAGDRRGGRQQRPARGAEFSGVVSSVNGQTLSLASGARVVVNGQTQWNARGDLTSLDQVAAAVAAGRRTRVEGRGTRQADGSFLAQSIKAETGR
jgi:hypothetical protein